MTRSLQTQLEDALKIIDDLKSQVERLSTDALIDPLTEIPNRKAVEQRMSQMMARAGRGARFSLVMIDIDRFKLLNDTLGHLAGDKALALVARVLEQTCRQVDFVGRFGGEEFVALLDGADRAGAATLCERLREAVASLEWDGPQITVSMGYALYEPGVPASELLSRADGAMYQAKRAGRNRVRGC